MSQRVTHRRVYPRGIRASACVAAMMMGCGWSTGALGQAAQADKPEPGSAGSGLRLEGYLSQLGAYTYAKPRHWSNATTRLQLGTRGEFGPGIKWRIAGRVDADPVYMGSDFYRNEVKRDQRINAFWRETYIDFTAKGWDFRLGAQNIVWGEAVGLFFADVVSRRDLRQFLLPPFDVIRQPQWAARAEYNPGNWNLDLVWIPVPGYDDIGKPGADFYPVALPSPTSDANSAVIQNIQRPGRSLNNSNFGARVGALVAGWDASAFFYRSFAGTPTFYRGAGSGSLPFTLTPRYDRITQTGLTVTQDFNKFVLRAEGVYTRGQGHSTLDIATPNGVVERSTLDYLVSIEFSLPRDTRLNIQAFQRVIQGGETDFALKTAGFGGSIFVSTKLTPTIEPQILWVQGFSGTGNMIRPRINWTMAKNTVLGFGVDIFTGPTNSLFGRYGNRDRVYAELRYTF